MDSDPGTYSIVNGGRELLNRIAPLWHELRQHHADLAPRWRESQLSKTFEQRQSELVSKSGTGLLVSLAVSGGAEIGYCVSTISADGQGEVDSLFVLPSARKRGVGSALLAEAMRWFDSRSVQAIAVEVIAGNNAAIEFYSRYGFSPRTVRLLVYR